MTRIIPPLFLLLLLTSVAAAQPANDRATGLGSSSALGSQELIDYLKAFRTANTNIEIETRGATRRMFGAQRISIQATWRKKPGSDGPVLHSATIRPTAGGRLKLGDNEINSLTINSKGEIKIDRKGIDVTIYKITRRANGDLVLDTPWWTFGDPVIKAADVPFDIKKWPPELQQLIEAIMNPTNKGRTTTKHEARISWDISGEADPYPLPFGDGNLKAASTVRIRGAGELRPDGSFRTIGAGNDLTLELRVNRGGRVSTPRGAGGRIDGGNTRFNGKYGIRIPADGKPFSLAIDGQLDYTLDGSRITLNVPGGPLISAGKGHVEGSGRLTGSFGSDGSTVALRDGVYSIKLDGPLAISRLEGKDFTLDDLDLDGSITSSGTVEELSPDRILTRGSWNGEFVTGNAVGLDGALQGKTGNLVTAELREGSRVTIKSDEVELDARLTGPNRGTTVTGKITADADLGVDEVRISGGDGRAEVEAARVKARLEGRLGSPSGDFVDQVKGKLEITIEKGGDLTTTGLGGAPILPAGERKHVVQPGETINDLARKYGVPTKLIRAANNLTEAPSSSRYRVNANSLRVRSGPGTENAILGTVKRGDEVEVTSVENGWAKLANGGFVSADFLDALPASSSQLRPGQEIKIPGSAPQVDAVPATGSAKTRIEDGTTASIELTDGAFERGGRIRAKGFVSASLRLKDFDLRSGTLETKLLAVARATLPRTAFEVGGPGPGFQLAEIKIPVRIDLSRGSRVHTTDSAGREMDIQFDRDGSYAVFTVVARYENGRLKIPELQEVDMLLQSNSATKFAGEVVDIAGDKSLSFKGRLVLLADGMDFMGDVAIISRGSDTRPALRIRW
ncbi:MAG: SH3 domain-containing protein [Planctomycetes bacterium]|nr:SH3 domain-containing protein [Planctomycetota bacterium]